jgi:Ca2+-binding RTX toxin-like protein
VVGRLAGVLAVVAAALASGAAAATTSSDGNGTVLLDGAKTFPIVLAKGPEPATTTPEGRDALAEVASGGATYLKTGPATIAWTTADIEDAKAQNRAAAANGLHTWVNLSTVARATPGTTGDALLARVVTELESDSGGPAIGIWKGADEPLWSGIAPSALQFAYCRSTGRGDSSWCGGEPVLDADHAWVTIQAPRGTAPQLAPYTPVTDIHGVDVYPVTLTASAPNLHDVGTWTSTIGSVTPSRAVWTTLQVCASGSYDSSGNFRLPTFAQERYMLYDAILNGARSIAFYGGNNPNCWTPTDSQFGWNWSFWNSVLKPLLGEINSLSPLAPALVNPATTQTLQANDATTQAISRQGNSGDLWVIAARHGAGTAHVTIGSLPAAISTGTVYTEGRSIAVSNGSFTDDFAQWGVHVYHFVPDPPQPPPQPPPAQPPPAASTEPVNPPAAAPVVIPPVSPPPSGAKAARRTLRTGTAGRDTLRGTNGPDGLFGLGGRDVLYGFSGADTLVGGIGADRLFGGAGNDTILARDRARDTIACGSGRDVVQADPSDRVARDCERVIRVRR